MVVSDAGNNRILIMDSELNVLSEIRRPTDVSVDQTLPFKPNKLVVTAEHIYAQVQSVNKGLMEFSLDGDFVGYIGASPVKFDWEDYLWKVFSTDEQREAMQAFVPTEYNNVALDSEGFLYVTNSIFSKQELNAGDAEPVRRLNLKGTNILIQNGNNRIIGDLRWDSLGPSKFVDVTALDDGTYFLLDSVRSRIFAYDYQGNMLYAFGGIGTKSGYFTTPVSIEHHGKDLLVLDSANGMITVMKHTGFGALVANAISAYGVGDYNTSMEYWKEVLVLNGSYELAYRGIGKVLLRNVDYVEALDYLEYAKDYYYYSKAWQSYRKDWIESNILYIVGGLALLAVAYLVYSLITKIRGKVEYYEMWHPSAGTEN
jgi:tetratricopeptide (TPR) repeat protein